MHVVITGASGFVGRALVKRLLKDGRVAGMEDAISAITALDLRCDGLPDDPRLRRVEGSIDDEAVLRRAFGDGVDLMFHLASIPGGAAERDFELGRRINLEATELMLELLRPQSKPARFVFTSTIAVYGSPMPAEVNDASLLRPNLSYGAHKLIGEILVQDYSRRGWLDGRTVRLPGIVARPPAPSGLLSAFMSDVFWKLAAGEPFVCPVSAQATAWWMSVGCCVDNLLHAAGLAPERVAVRREYALPVLRLSMAQVVDGLAALYGEDRHGLVTYEPNEGLEAGFGRFPPLDASVAEAIGFRHDGSVEALIKNAMAV